MEQMLKQLFAGIPNIHPPIVIKAWNPPKNRAINKACSTVVLSTIPFVMETKQASIASPIAIKNINIKFID